MVKVIGYIDIIHDQKSVVTMKDFIAFYHIDEITPEKLFEAAAKNLLSELVNAEVHKASYEHISVMLDSIPVQKKRKSIIGTLKRR